MFPTASYTSASNGVSVQFTDTSSGTPESWQWDFGDGEISIEQSPVHVFASKKFYLVTLTVVNTDGVDSITHLLDLSGMPQLTGTIDEFITIEAGALATNIDPAYRTLQTQYWQLYLQKGPTPQIPNADVFNESKWPSLYRLLIAKLVVYSYYLSILKGSLATSLGGGSTTSSGAGGLKKVVTGPAEAEFFNPAELYIKLLSKTSSSGGTLFDTISSDVCTLGNRLGVKLPMCAAKIIIGPLIGGGWTRRRWEYSPSTNAWYGYEIDYRTSFKGYIF
jgi:PKD repeat protein